MKVPDTSSFSLDGLTIPEFDRALGIPSIGATGLNLESLIAKEERERAAHEEGVRNQISRLYEVQAARTALEELVSKAGVDPKIIVEHLWLLAATHARKTKSLSTVPGVPLRKIRKLPKILRELSHQIEAINKHGYDLSPRQLAMVMFIPRFQNMYMIRKRLPSFLRIHANELSMWLSARQNPRTKKLEPTTERKIQFAEYVRQNSNDRKQHYQALEALINAFYRLEGIAASVNTDSLKALWSAHPELRKPPEPPPVAPGLGLPTAR